MTCRPKNFFRCDVHAYSMIQENFNESNETSVYVWAMGMRKERSVVEVHTDLSEIK